MNRIFTTISASLILITIGNFQAEANNRGMNSDSGSIENISGVWGGVGKQDSNQKWTVVIQFRKDKIYINYDSIPCSGYLEKTYSNQSYSEYTEIITKDTNNCVNNGSVKLSLQENENLSFVWYYPSGGRGAQATLARYDSFAEAQARSKSYLEHGVYPTGNTAPVASSPPQQPPHSPPAIDATARPVASSLPPPGIFLGPRRALVIAAKSYRDIPPLERTITDAQALTKALRARGFKVTPVEDPDRRTLMLAVANFAEDLRQSPDALAFVLFSGHGVALDGTNYLLPVDFPSIANRPLNEGEALIRGEALSLDALLAPLKDAAPRHLVALFDACRDNPLAGRSGKSIGGTRGLARIQSENGAYIMFAAGAGETALDRLPGADSSPYGLFMRHFLSNLSNQDWPLHRAFVETARRVKHDALQAGHKQSPALYTQEYDDIIMASPSNR